jgi:uncharacterized protein
MIAPDLLKILCCPETLQPLELADPQFLDKLNQQAQAGTLKNRAGKPVTQPLDAGLVRADRKILYPVFDDIPVLLTDEGIAVE